MTEIELKIPFGEAINQARQHLGPILYYLHNQAGSHDWVVRLKEGRTFLQVRDPRMAVFFRLKI